VAEPTDQKVGRIAEVKIWSVNAINIWILAVQLLADFKYSQLTIFTRRFVDGLLLSLLECQSMLCQPNSW
jgi:hypothetical protein